jgi:hypothetical protein
MKVKEILLTHEIAEGKEPWPVEDIPFEVEGNIAAAEDSAEEIDGPVEWDFTKKEDDDQPTLFD